MHPKPQRRQTNLLQKPQTLQKITPRRKILQSHRHLTIFRQIEHFIRQTNNDLDNDDLDDSDNNGQKLMTELLPICILIRNQKNNNNLDFSLGRCLKTYGS